MNTTGTDPSSTSNGLRDAVQAASLRARGSQNETDRREPSKNGDCTVCGTEVELPATGMVRCPNGCATEPEIDERGIVRYAYRAEEYERMRYQPASHARKVRPRDPSTVPPIDRVLRALNAAGCDWRCGRDVDQWQSQCPTHDDNRPSLVIRRNHDGSVWLKCWGGCSKEGILAALGLEWRDLWEASERDFDRAKPNVRPLLAPHLRRAMVDLLRLDDERRAA